MKKMLIFLSLLVITGCVTTKQANKRINAWEKVTLSTLINAWGIPTKEQLIASRKFYVWNQKNRSNTPAIGISAGSFGGRGGISINTLFGADSTENFCSRVVEVGIDQQIKSIQWTGDPGFCLEITPERVQ